MALTGTFLADFSSFQAAVDDSIVKLNSFQDNAGKVGTALDRVSNSLSGVQIVQQATLAAAAVDAIGGVSMLTEAELARVGATATEAAAKLTAMGQDVPPKIQAIADAANSTSQSFSEWLSAIDIQKAISDPIGTAKEGMLAFAESLGPVGIAVAGVVLAVSGGAAALYELATNAAATGESVEAFALVTGTAVDQVGAIAAGATIAGTSLDAFQQMLVQTQRRMDATGPSADKFNAALADLNINADAFRAADPSDRITMLADGMQAAAGSTNLMSDALAIMGRAGAQNIPALMKYTTDVQQAGADLGYTWDTVTTKAAVDLGEATATTGVELSTLATTIGVALIPAVTGAVEIFNATILALEHIADLGGLVSGGWHLITGAVGETALAEQTALAIQDQVNALWAKAAAAGLDLNDATYAVAAAMLKGGASIQLVAEQTGLAVDQVNLLKEAMKAAATAADTYADLWDRVNAALSTGAPTLDGISASTKGLVMEMQAAGVPMADIIAAMKDYSVSAGQVALIISTVTKAHADAAAALKAFQAAEVDVNSAGATWQDTLSGIDAWTLQNMKDLQAAGVPLQSILTYYGQGKDVGKAFTDMLKDQSDTLKLNATAVLAVTKLWDDYAAVVASDSGSAYDKAGAAIDKWYSDTVAAHQKSKTDTAAFYDAVAALDDAKWAHLALNTLQADVTTKAYLDKQAAAAQAAYDFAVAHSDNETDVELANLRRKADAAAAAAAQWGSGLDAGSAARVAAFEKLSAAEQAEQTILGATGLSNAELIQTQTDAQNKLTGAVQGTTVATTALSAARDVLAGTFQIPSDTGTADTIESRLAALTTSLAGGIFINTAGGFQGLPAAQSHAAGGPVMAGPAMLHDNEYVVPEGGALVSRGGGSSGVTVLATITVAGSVIAERDFIARASASIVKQVLAGVQVAA